MVTNFGGQDEYGLAALCWAGAVGEAVDLEVGIENGAGDGVRRAGLAANEEVDDKHQPHGSLVGSIVPLIALLSLHNKVLEG